MSGFDPTTYGDDLGAAYDDLYPAEGLETDAAVELLGELARARGSSILELGIGTGRLALPLQKRGLRVAGIEASSRTIEVLRAKPGGDTLTIAVGDMTDTRVDGTFSVVAIVFNTILDPRGLPALDACFANAARHLEPGGCFVVEAFVLGEAERDGSWSVRPRYVGDRHVEFQLARFDIETSRMERTLVHLREGGADFVTVEDHYAGPGELDVLAHVHGMTRIARYADWHHAPFTAASRRHITVYAVDG